MAKRDATPRQSRQGGLAEGVTRHFGEDLMPDYASLIRPTVYHRRTAQRGGSGAALGGKL